MTSPDKEPTSEGGDPLQSCPPVRRRDSTLTCRAILHAAGRRFARAAYSDVTLQEIADDVGITPALIVRYFESKRGLFREAVRADSFVEFRPTDRTNAAEGLARSFIDFWQDEDARWIAMALIRSPDAEDTAPLFNEELRRRLRDPLRETFITGDDVDMRLRLLAAVGVGFGLFGLGVFFDPDVPRLDPADEERAARYLAAMIDVCLDHPDEGGAATADK